MCRTGGYFGDSSRRVLLDGMVDGLLEMLDYLKPKANSFRSSHGGCCSCCEGFYSISIAKEVPKAGSSLLQVWGRGRIDPPLDFGQGWSVFDPTHVNIQSPGP